MKKNILRFILIIFIIFWMYTVFGFSNATATESSGISKSIAEFFVKDEQYVHFVEKIIRKIAHLIEYAIGGFLVYALLLTYNLRPKKQFLFAWLFVVIYAITDEIHQLVVPGRAGRFVDIYIDTLGALLGCLGLLFLTKIYNIFKTRKTVIDK